jgi:hypothetical protein
MQVKVIVQANGGYEFEHIADVAEESDLSGAIADALQAFRLRYPEVSTLDSTIRIQQI